jgi:hypothetical protein
MKPFVLYSLRHTFLTRLGQSGCGAWTLARIAGHSSIAISSRYVHPSEETVLAAFSRLGGHNFGSNAEKREIVTDVSRAEAIAFKEKTGAPGEIRTPDLLLRSYSQPHWSELHRLASDWFQSGRNPFMLHKPTPSKQVLATKSATVQWGSRFPETREV